jgi:hypothetical protein
VWQLEMCPQVVCHLERYQLELYLREDCLLEVHLHWSCLPEAKLSLRWKSLHSDCAAMPCIKDSNPFKPRQPGRSEENKIERFVGGTLWPLRHVSASFYRRQCSNWG